MLRIKSILNQLLYHDFIQAIINNNKKIVRSYIANNPNNFDKPEYDLRNYLRFPLDYAINNKSNQMIELLIDLGCKRIGRIDYLVSYVNNCLMSEDKNGLNIITNKIHPSFYNYKDLPRKNLDQENIKLITKKNDFILFKWIVEVLNNLSNPEVMHYYIICEAIKNNNIKFVEYIASRWPACINKRFEKITPLEIAIMEEYSDIAKLLLEKGADSNISFKNAVANNNHKAIDKLCQIINDVNMNSSVIIATKGNYRAEKNLISADEFKLGEQEESMVLRNFNYGIKVYPISYLDTLQALLKNQANPNMTDESNRTPLMYASASGFVECVDVLLSHGAETTLKDYYGNTALMYSCEDPIISPNELLISNAPFEINNIVETKIIDDEQSKLSVIDKLLSAGENINATDNDGGDTALMIALRNKKFHIAKKLIECKADTSIINKCGETALSINTDPEIAKMLIEIEDTIDYQKRRLKFVIERQTKDNNNAAIVELTKEILELIQLNIDKIPDEKSLSKIFNEISNFTANLTGYVDDETKDILLKLSEFNRRAAARFGDNQAKSIVDNFYDNKHTLTPTKPTMTFTLDKAEDEEKTYKSPKEKLNQRL